MPPGKNIFRSGAFNFQPNRFLAKKVPLNHLVTKALFSVDVSLKGVKGRSGKISVFPP